MKRAIAIFAKPPVAGQTKSRLAADTSPDFAAKLSGAMLTELIDQATGMNADVILYYPPGSDPAAFGVLADRVRELRLQRGSDLGERMHGCIADLLASYSQVIIIGSDCISHSTASLNTAFDALADHDLVVQPADDGGYVLIGMSVISKRVFQGIDWGTETVMAQTRNALASAGCRYVELSTSFDIDTAEDLIRLREFLGSNCRPQVEAVMSEFTGSI